jgi:nicotinate phosphoribosyltransferase
VSLEAPSERARVTPGDIALLTDLYQLTMLQAYWRENMNGEAVFSLFVRRLPHQRNFLVAAGLDEALRCLETLHFSEAALAFLGQRPEFSADFLAWLRDLRFTGQVRAMPEGTVLFASEPILEVEASLPEAQLAETILMNQIHLQTMLASKAARVVLAAQGRTVVDFGLRRMHGIDAGLKAARAFHIAGVNATSNVLAGAVYGVPIAGTMAHSYVQAHPTEADAFRAFVELYPDTVLLVDTYDTLDGVRSVVDLARELGPAFRVRAIRLDSGDIGKLARESRQLLDDAGLEAVRIFASGGLNEHTIERLLAEGAPIDGFGVGTSMGTSSDAPSLDIAYKLTEYAGTGRLKLSPGKSLLPGRKQVYRMERNGRMVADVIGRDDEDLPGRPLLVDVMKVGRRIAAGRVPLDQSRAHAAAQLRALPPGIRTLEHADPAYPVDFSTALKEAGERAAQRATTS